MIRGSCTPARTREIARRIRADTRIERGQSCDSGTCRPLVEPGSSVGQGPPSSIRGDEGKRDLRVSGLTKENTINDAQYHVKFNPIGVRENQPRHHT